MGVDFNKPLILAWMQQSRLQRDWSGLDANTWRPADVGGVWQQFRRPSQPLQGIVSSIYRQSQGEAKSHSLKSRLGVRVNCFVVLVCLLILVYLPAPVWQTLVYCFFSLFGDVWTTADSCLIEILHATCQTEVGLLACLRKRSTCLSLCLISE